MWEGTRSPERERGVAWRPHGIMRSSDDGGRRSILIEHSYLNVSESVTAVYMSYIAAHVFQFGPRVHRGIPHRGGGAHPGGVCGAAGFVPVFVPRLGARAHGARGGRAPRP